MTDLALTTPEPVAVSATGWEPVRALTYDEWEVAGHALQNLGRAWQWWLGDWLCYGEKHYSEKYVQAIEHTGYEYSTLSNVAYVAKHVESSRRREDLPWSHHAEVAKLPPDEQDAWLERSLTEGLTVQRLRARLKSGADPALDAGPEADLRPAFHAEVRFEHHAESQEDAWADLRRLCELLEKKGVRITYKNTGGR